MRDYDSVNFKEKLLPLLLTLAVILADQVSKMIAAATLPFARPVEVLGNFLRLTYLTNTAIAFSIGRNLPSLGKQILFLVLPFFVLGFLIYYYFFSKDISRGQRWLLAAIMGGGLGNYIDRLFRREGVIDFIDVKFYGIFGFSRWPTFNLADSTIVVALVLLMVSYFRMERQKKNE